MTGGYVKLFRSIEKWEWYQDTNTKVLFLHCLIKANHKPKKWQGIDVDSGKYITSYSKLAKELNLSIHQIRVALEHLKMTGELTHQTARHMASGYSLITVVKWADYQCVNDDDDTPSGTPNDTPSGNKQEDKKKRNIRSNNKEGDVAITSLNQKSVFGEFDNVKLTSDEMSKIKSSGLTEYIQTLSAYKKSTGKKYQSDYATILNWSRKDGKGKRNEPIPEYGQSETTVDVEELKKKLRSLK